MQRPKHPEEVRMICNLFIEEEERGATDEANGSFCFSYLMNVSAVEGGHLREWLYLSSCLPCVALK